MGLIAGFSSSIRTDTALTFPALVLPLLFARPCRFREVLIMVLGSLPGLTIAGFCNYIKFGDLSPFSYGGSHPNAAAMADLKHLAIPVLAGLLIAWVITRSENAEIRRKCRNGLLVLVCVAGVAAVVLYPGITDTTASVMTNARVALIDMTGLDPGAVFAPMERTPSGAVTNSGSVQEGPASEYALSCAAYGANCRNRAQRP